MPGRARRLKSIPSEGPWWLQHSNKHNRFQKWLLSKGWAKEPLRRSSKHRGQLLWIVPKATVCAGAASCHANRHGVSSLLQTYSNFSDNSFASLRLMSNPFVFYLKKKKKKKNSSFGKITCKQWSQRAQKFHGSFRRKKTLISSCYSLLFFSSCYFFILTQGPQSSAGGSWKRCGSCWELA